MAEIIIIVGSSGAGKSICSDTFEEAGYFCIDNIPTLLVPKFAELIKSNSEFEKVALVINPKKNIQSLIKELDVLKNEALISYNVLYLEASNQILLNRYQESRKKHPFLTSKGLENAIKKEKELLEPLRIIATKVIDTSHLNAKDLKKEIQESFFSKNFSIFNVNFQSFGFKKGIPSDADFVFDVRFLINPFYIKEIKHLTGLDPIIYNYVLEDEKTKEFLATLMPLLDNVISNHFLEGKQTLTISFGCTGGKHRSVTLAEYAKKSFELYYDRKLPVNSSHRDINA